MKRTCIFLLCLLMIICSITSAQAKEAKAIVATPTLTFNGQTAQCAVQIVSPNDYIVVRMQLWYGNVCLGTWHGSGSSAVTISQPCSVQSGNIYTLKVFGTIDDTAFSCTPLSKKCP